jgi:hypothetical protein
MLQYLFLALCLIVGLFLLGRWFLQADPKTVRRALLWVAGTVGTLAVVALVVFKRFNLLIYTLPFLLPFLFRLGHLLRRIKAAQGGSRGQRSSVRTRFLEMELDHDSGRLEGVVREGPFAGARLAELSLEQAVELWRLCHAEDEESAAVLEAYLDRTHGEAWREALNEEEAGESRQRRERAEAGAGGAARGGGAMTRREALAVLGLEEGADEAAIRRAHRRLMQQLHPDHGGSNYLAAKINEAKQVLLGS